VVRWKNLPGGRPKKRPKKVPVPKSCAGSQRIGRTAHAQAAGRRRSLKATRRCLRVF
jgi:hypothetical protein